MKKNLILLFGTFLISCFSIFGQENTEVELNLDKTPYELFVLSGTELLKAFDLYDEAMMTSMSATDIQTIQCQKRCLKVNIQISEKYQQLDPTFTLRKIQEGKTSNYSDAWTEEISRCNCE